MHLDLHLQTMSALATAEVALEDLAGGLARAHPKAAARLEAIAEDLRRAWYALDDASRPVPGIPRLPLVRRGAGLRGSDAAS
jgi:hypothetical protein